VPNTSAPEPNRPEDFGKEFEFGDYVVGLIDEGCPIRPKCPFGFVHAILYFCTIAAIERQDRTEDLVTHSAGFSNERGFSDNYSAR
jgi:hypothetical protein